MLQEAACPREDQGCLPFPELRDLAPDGRGGAERHGGRVRADVEQPRGVLLRLPRTVLPDRRLRDGVDRRRHAMRPGEHLLATHRRDRVQGTGVGPLELVDRLIIIPRDPDLRALAEPRDHGLPLEGRPILRFIDQGDVDLGSEPLCETLPQRRVLEGLLE